MAHMEESVFGSQQPSARPGTAQPERAGIAGRVLPALGWLAAALVIPMLLHPLGLGPALLPMHFPVLLAGASLGPAAGMALGAAAPWLSTLLTGMPPVSPPIAPLMVIELMTYGGVAGALRRRLVPGSQGFLSAYLWLIPSLIAGRLALAAAVAVLGPSLGSGVQPAAYVHHALLTGLPGVAFQLILIPVISRVWISSRRK